MGFVAQVLFQLAQDVAPDRMIAGRVRGVVLRNDETPQMRRQLRNRLFGGGRERHLQIVARPRDLGKGDMRREGCAPDDHNARNPSTMRRRLARRTAGMVANKLAICATPAMSNKSP